MIDKIRAHIPAMFHDPLSGPRHFFTPRPAMRSRYSISEVESLMSSHGFRGHRHDVWNDCE